MTETWIVLGATSAMARPLIRALATKGAAMVLAGRDTAELDRLATDCRIAGAPEALAVTFDARAPAGYAALVEQMAARPGVLNAISFVGSMPEQSEIDANPDLIAGVMQDSMTGPAIFLSRLAPVLEARGAGVIVGISSVAGDRGRLGNYVYGASKAAFSTYLSGLRNRLGRSGVHVMTVKPGPVDTPMTFGKKMPLMTTPEAVAKDILRGIEKRRNVIYTAPIWRLVMAVITHIPEPIFKKMSF